MNASDQNDIFRGLSVGVALCGSFCTFADAVKSIAALVSRGCAVHPIMSFAAANTDTRFGRAEDLKTELKLICDRDVICTLEAAEPIGPKKLLDVLAVAPATGNTLAKLANGIADTPVTLAAKAHLRNDRPVVIAVSSNDSLGANAKNIGVLLARKNIYFVPMRQDDPDGKPCSVVADLTYLPAAIQSALAGKQLQPVLLGPGKV